MCSSDLEDYRDHHLKAELQAFDNFQYRFFAIEPQVKEDFAYSAFRYELSADTERSEERRVGKECRSRWWTYH